MQNLIFTACIVCGTRTCAASAYQYSSSVCVCVCVCVCFFLDIICSTAAKKSLLFEVIFITQAIVMLKVMLSSMTFQSDPDM